MRFDPNYVTAQLTPAIDASSAQQQQLTSELSSGLRVSSLSDDPVAVSANVGLQGALSERDAFTQSSATVTGQLQVTDSVLGEVVAQVTSAISLATSAGNGTLSGANLQSVSQQVGSLRDSIVQLANTSYQGQYLFSGSQGNTQPFTVDTTTAPATVAYAGDGQTATTVTPDGQQLKTSLAGSAVFTAPGADLLGTLNQLVSDIGAGDTGAVTADTANLTAALGNVTEQRSVLDSSLSRLNDATSYAGTQETVLKAQQSALLSADTAQVATELSAAETEHQALLSTVAALSQNNLFAVLYKG